MTIKKSIMFRMGVIYLFFLALALWLCIEIINLKFIQADKWKTQSHEVERSENIVMPNRGDILDVNGKKLATSVPSYRLYMDLLAEGLTDAKFNSNIDSLSICLANLFKDKSAAAYKRDLQLARQKGRRYHLVNQSACHIPSFRWSTNSRFSEKGAIRVVLFQNSWTVASNHSAALPHEPSARCTVRVPRVVCSVSRGLMTTSSVVLLAPVL